MLNLSRNVYLMIAIMSLSFTGTSMMVLVAGLLGAAIAPSPDLATLPIAVMIIGTAAATIPAAMLMQRVGRKAGMAIGLGIALFGTCLAYQAALSGNFNMFLVGSVCLGFNAAFTQQGRFIIMENSGTPQQSADGLSLALMANLFAAVIGPLIGAYGKDLIYSPAGFAGSFLLAGLFLVLALLVLSMFQNRELTPNEQSHEKRSIASIVSQPTFMLAAGSAAVGYGVMALIMTATPISMHEMNKLSLTETTLVIQSHIVAMFLPSLLSGFLLKRGLRISLIVTGLGLYLLVAMVGLSGITFWHYWFALVLLGLGWNLIFLTSTTILPTSYREDEKYQAQAINDFLIFSTQAVAAFGAGWLVFNLGWSSVLWIALICSGLWLGLVYALKVYGLESKQSH